MEYLQYQLHVLASTLAIIRLAINLLRDNTICMVVQSLDKLTLRVLMSYIYMEHLFLMFLDHTRRRSTVGRTPLDE